MNRTEAKEWLKLMPVIKAFANGEDVQYQSRFTGEWTTLIGDPIFNPDFKYRIAPKPKTCERWCFAYWRESEGDSATWTLSKASAESWIAHVREQFPDATFSPIVRVEFVEE